MSTSFQSQKNVMAKKLAAPNVAPDRTHLRVSPIIYGMVTPGKTPFICVMMNEMKNKSFRDIDIGLT